MHKSRLTPFCYQQLLMSYGEGEIQAISQIFYESVKNLDHEEQLDPFKLAQFKQEHFKPLFPHMEDGQQKRKYLCCEACSQSPGFFCCGLTKTPDNQFIKFGLSICLYFKFLKHYSFFGLFMTGLAILSCVVCYHVAVQNDISTMSNYSNFLFSTTYGSFASQHNKCKYGLLNNNVVTYSSSFNIKCPNGIIKLIGATPSIQSLNSLYNCRNEKKKLYSNSNSTSYLLTDSTVCNSGYNECNITLNFKPTIASTQYTTAAYCYQCLENTYTIRSISTTSENYFRFVVAVDVFISLCFLIFLASETKSEERETEYFKKNQVSLEDYSLRIKGFTTKSAELELQLLFKALNKRYNADITKSIVSFTFPENERMFNLYQQKYKAFNSISSLIEEYYFYDEGNRTLGFWECHERVFGSSDGDERKRERYREYSKQLSDMVKRVIQLEKERIQIDTESTEKVSCYLVFNQIKRKEYVKGMIEETCCSKNEINVENRVYEVESAPIPDMILWENRFSWTKIRVFFSWILTIVICVGSYLLFGFIQYKQSQLSTTYNYNIDCDVLYSSTQLSIVDSTLLLQANYVTCICKSKSLLDSSSQNSDYCSTWQQQYILYLTVPLLISLGIVVYNVVVSYIFQFMSKLENHKTIIDEEVSYTFKRAFLLIMNMGLIMILLNYNYNNSIDLTQISFIFLGKFDDFTSDWYESIGAIIILTMIFNIATPIAEFLLTVIKKGVKKCFDTRCRRVPTSRKTKNEYIEYYSDQIFLIGQRYAYVIATFFITFSFSGVIPILTPISLISFILLYFSDKLLIFKFYRTPINYTQTLHKIFINVLLVSIISHYSLTAYFLSQSTIIAPNNSIATPTPSIISNGRINNMITTIYIYPYLGLLALIIIFLLLRICCGALIGTFKRCCDRGYKYEVENNAITKEFQFWGVLSDLQINELLKVMEYSSERFDRKLNGVATFASIISKNILKQSEQKAFLASQVLMNSIGRLKLQKNRIEDKRSMFDRAALLGLPSYEFLIKSDKLSRNAMMMHIERELTTFYQQKMMRNVQNKDVNNSSNRLRIQ